MHTSFLNCHDFRYILKPMERTGGGVGVVARQAKITVSVFFLLLPAEQGERQHSENSTLRPAAFMHSTRRRKGNSALMKTGKCCIHWSGLRNHQFLHSHFVTGHAKMTGCAKRCKHGFVKFVLSLHRLVTGTLIKGKKRIFSIVLVFECSRVWIYQREWCSQDISAPLLYCEQLWWGIYGQKWTETRLNFWPTYLSWLMQLLLLCSWPCFSWVFMYYTSSRGRSERD